MQIILDFGLVQAFPNSQPQLLIPNPQLLTPNSLLPTTCIQSKYGNFWTSIKPQMETCHPNSAIGV